MPSEREWGDSLCKHSHLGIKEQGQLTGNKNKKPAQLNMCLLFSCFLPM
jgi:hypothetical protein